MICLKRLIFNKKYLFSCMHAQPVLSYLLILVPRLGIHYKRNVHTFLDIVIIARLINFHHSRKKDWSGSGSSSYGVGDQNTDPEEKKILNPNPPQGFAAPMCIEWMTMFKVSFEALRIPIMCLMFRICLFAFMGILIKPFKNRQDLLNMR